MAENKTYIELLKDPRWQKKRLQIMKRDKFACKLCGDKETTLNIHHKKYEYGKDPWDYPNDTLITVCEDCHGIIEAYRKSKTEFTSVNVLKLKGPNEIHFFIDEVDCLTYIGKDPNWHIARFGNCLPRIIKFIENLKHNG